MIGTEWRRMGMDTTNRQITLSTVAGGAADELFIDAMAKVLQNIADLNTDHRIKREIVLKFQVSADEERRVGKMSVSCTTKLAGVKGLEVGVYFGTHYGVQVAVEAPRQTDLFPTPTSLLKSVRAEKAVQP